MHVRGDHGSENVEVKDHMERALGPGAYVGGRSIHNTRIERFWVDVSKVVITFHELFHDLEDTGRLDVYNEESIQMLHNGN
jgi:hypothetical protein